MMAKDSAHCWETGSGRDWINGLTNEMAAAPPMADARVPTSVTPIWTVARNRSGSFFNRATAAAERTPFSSKVSIRLLRVAMMAISEAAKKPLAKIRKKTSVPSSQKLSKNIGVSPVLFCLSEFGENGRDGLTAHQGVVASGTLALGKELIITVKFMSCLRKRQGPSCAFVPLR